MGTNRTRFKTLDKLAAEPRVDEIWSEGADGIWVSLNNGFQWDGVHCVHEWTVRDVLTSFRSVEPCQCKECSPPSVR